MEVFERLFKKLFLSWITLSLVFHHFFLIRTISHFEKPYYTHDLWLTATYILSNYYMIVARKQIFGASKRIFEVLKESDPMGLVRLEKNYTLALTFIGGFYTLLWIACHHFYNNGQPLLDKVLTFYFFGGGVQSWKDSSKEVVLFFISILFAVCNFGFCFFLAVTYSFMSLALTKTTRPIEAMLSSLVTSKVDDTDLIRGLIERVQLTRRLVEEVNEALQYVVAIWYVAFLVQACIGILLLISDIESAGSKQFKVLVFYFTQFLALMAMTTVFASRLSSKFDRLACLLHQVSTKATRYGKGNQLHLLFNLMTNPRVGLSVGGLFINNINFFVSFVGIGSSYAAILIQLSPGIMGKLQQFLRKP